MSEMSETHALVESLRDWAGFANEFGRRNAGATFSEAADEIEQSRAVMKQMADALDDIVDWRWGKATGGELDTLRDCMAAANAYRKIRAER